MNNSAALQNWLREQMGTRTFNDLEKDSGISHTTWARICNNKSAFVTDKTVAAICRLFRVSPSQLGDIAVGTPLSGTIQPAELSRRTVGVYGRANCAVAPRWGDTIPDGDDVPQVDLPDVLEKYRRAAAFRAADESMSPTIHDGDLIFFSPDAEKTNGCVVVVKFRDTVYCKRWYPSNSHVTLTSDAPGIPPLVVPGKEIEWAYRAVLVRSEKKL
jgi:phage repressor protein C with HTH and peptisase S24 domain